MINKLLCLFLLCAPAAVQADMVRVIAIEDGRAITVERSGAREKITLAGVAITDEVAARDLLRWTIASGWVMLEKAPNGDYLAWRSPDALFVNRELVIRGFARATLAGIAPQPQLAVTYLGKINPSAERSTRAQSNTRPSAARSRSSGRTARKQRPRR